MFAFLFLLVALIVPTPVFAGDTYVCPMHCEGKKTYEKPGKCPVCGMDLEKETAGGEVKSLNTKDYRVDFGAETPQAKAN